MTNRECPNCNGSGVIQEYDEFDRYHVFECYKCGGSGVIAEIQNQNKQREKRLKMNKSPNDGGCWFCHNDNDKEEMFFSFEFDCYFHKECLQKTLDKVEWNPESEIMANEIGIKYHSKVPEINEDNL